MNAQPPPTWQIVAVIAALSLPAASLAGLVAALVYRWIAKRLALRRLPASGVQAGRETSPAQSASKLGPGRFLRSRTRKGFV